MKVSFKWRMIGDTLTGFTVVAVCGHCNRHKESPYGFCGRCGKFPTNSKQSFLRETKVFEIFRRESRFPRPLQWRLVRVSSGGVEDFRTKKLAQNWAEQLLSKDVEINS
jgi:hypothetical protein